MKEECEPHRKSLLSSRAPQLIRMQASLLPLLLAGSGRRRGMVVDRRTPGHLRARVGRSSLFGDLNDPARVGVPSRRPITRDEQWQE